MRHKRGTRVSSDYSSKGHLFGWCMPGDVENHAGCVASFESVLDGRTYAYSCTCVCHGGVA